MNPRIFSVGQVLYEYLRAGQQDQTDATCDKAILYFDAFGHRCAKVHGLTSVRRSIRAEMQGVLPGLSEEQACESVLLACPTESGPFRHVKC